MNNKDKSQSTNVFIKHMKENPNLIPVQFRHACELAKLNKENVLKDLNQKDWKQTLTTEETCDCAQTIEGKHKVRCK